MGCASLNRQGWLLQGYAWRNKTIKNKRVKNERIEDNGRSGGNSGQAGSGSIVRNLERERWLSTPIGALVHPPEESSVIREGDDAWDALTRMIENGRPAVLVRRGGELVGMVTQEALTRLVMRKMRLGMDRRPSITDQQPRNEPPFSNGTAQGRSSFRGRPFQACLISSIGLEQRLARRGGDHRWRK